MHIYLFHIIITATLIWLTKRASLQLGSAYCDRVFAICFRYR
jgi:hypothetical protein